MTRNVHIGLIFDYDTGYCRGVLRGIKQYAEAMRHWVLVPVVADPRAVRALGKLNVDGLISWLFRRSVAAVARSLEKPWVSVCGVLSDDQIPRVGPDDFLMGQLAALHLLGCGIRRFAFIGHTYHAGADRREAGFRQTIERAGYSLDYYHEHGPRLFKSTTQGWAPNRSFRRWVLSLPTQVGVAAVYDFLGLQLSEACREAGLRVPEDVAIVGMGNDDLLCEFARPSLSSVAVANELIGYRAAALLDHLMKGHAPPPGPILVPPPGVVARQSSDVLAIGDDDVAAALRWIRAASHRPIRVDDLLRDIPVSRRLLERKFRRILGRGISEEIRRVHVERAKSLLAGTDLAMSALAVSAGFSNASHLSIVFRQATAQTPTAYRSQFRGRTHALIVGSDRDAIPEQSRSSPEQADL
jgi:LacI family transcriptional regulator